MRAWYGMAHPIPSRLPVRQVRNQEVNYKAIAFYLEQHPLKLVRLLQVLTPNLDHSRVVHQLRRAENLPLAMDYLKSVQKVCAFTGRTDNVRYLTRR